MAFQLSQLRIPNMTTDFSAENSAVSGLANAIGGLPGDLRKQAEAQAKKEMYANAAKTGDFNKIGLALLGTGDVQGGAALLGLGQKAQDRDLERAWMGQGGASGGMSLPGLGKQAAPNSLIQNESGGRWDAQNNEVGAGGQRGHFGRAQFGQARLQEAAAAGAIPQGTTPQAFMASPELQQRAEAWHFNDIDNFIRQKGYDRAVGQAQIGGVPVTVEGMRAVAHLGGKEGLARFIETGGRYNPADSNGTRLSDYFSRHGGGGGQPAPRAPGAQFAENEADVQRLEAQMPGFGGAPVQTAQAPAQPGDPRADVRPETGGQTQGFAIPPGTSPQQAQSLAADPGVQRAMQRLQTAPTERTRAIAKQELDVALADAKARTEGGKPTDVQRNYEVARRQGYQGTLLDYQKELRAQTTIKNEPAPPSGYRYVRDAEGNIERAEPIPGSKAAQEAEAAASKQQKAERIRAETGSIVGNALDDVDRLMSSATLPTTGALGARVAGIPGTAAYDISQALSTVGANISFNQLQQMREASPTGGALGAVSDTEQKLLQNSYAALSQSQSEAQFKTNLGRVRAIFERIVHGRTLNAQERKTGGPMTMERAKSLREEAAQAIAGGADRAAVTKRLKEDYGITPEGL